MAKIDDPEMDRMMKLIAIQIALDKPLSVLKELRRNLSTPGEEGRELSVNLSDAIEGVEEALKSVERCMGWR